VMSALALRAPGFVLHSGNLRQTCSLLTRIVDRGLPS
jgi:hypothetical protein